jgi:hypothetical protein
LYISAPEAADVGLTGTCLISFCCAATYELHNIIVIPINNMLRLRISFLL